MSDVGTEQDADEALPSVTYVGGDEALSSTEANDVTASRPTKVVVIAGEHKSGKTTLVVELFAKFLSGPFSGWIFAGSRTLRALHLRHRDALLSSGHRKATTERTQDDDMRLLHLDLAAPEARVNLLLSDVKGEFFGDLVDGAKVEDAVPLAARADLCVFVVNGEKLKKPSTRGATMWRARMLLAGLSEPGGLMEGTPLLIAVSKSDLLTRKHLSDLQEGLQELLEFATERGLNPELLTLSARPDDTSVMPIGLEELLAWLVLERRSATDERGVELPETDRFYWRKGI